MGLKVFLKNTSKHINIGEFYNYQDRVNKIDKDLRDLNNGKHKDWVGWLSLPENYNREEIEKIKSVAKRVRENCDIFIVIGTGGSYLGAKSVIDMLKGEFYNLSKKPQILFLGNNLNASQINEAINMVKEKNVIINMISKSGTTLEPNIVFELLKNELEEKYGKATAREHIICTTDKKRGALKQLANTEGYETFVVPDDIGGRYSVLTPVGLLPIAVAGINVDKLLEGAYGALNDFKNTNLNENECYKYAVIRYMLSKLNYNIDIYSMFDPNCSMFGAWLIQLFGESEGKDGLGLFPTSVVFPRDLHSLGQFIQDGSKCLFETFIFFEGGNEDIKLDKITLSNTNGKTINEVNKIVYDAATLAHFDGGIPIIFIEPGKLNEENVGCLIYFFELACAIYCTLLGVNPFDQPGVEKYKINIKSMM